MTIVPVGNAQPVPSRSQRARKSDFALALGNLALQAGLSLQFFNFLAKY